MHFTELFLLQKKAMRHNFLTASILVIIISTLCTSVSAGKAGIAWGAFNDNMALQNFKSNNTGPIMTWSPWIPPIARTLGFTPVPMLWGEKQVSAFQHVVTKNYAQHVLGFNEPNQFGQAAMSPQRAAQLWKQHMEPLKFQGYTLISPACSNAASGRPWMKEFLAACQGCHIDGIAVHFYDTDPQRMIVYLQEMHQRFGLPVWPTEFACQSFSGRPQCNMEQVWRFMRTVKAFMDNTDWIPYYFAFGMLHDMGNVNPLNQLIRNDGQPTALGRFYIS